MIPKMKCLFKILIIAVLASLTIPGFSQRRGFDFGEEKQTVELTVNGDRIVVKNLPQDGRVEIFNILGSKVMTFSIRGGVNVNRINLPVGYYILKSDNVTRKIVVK